jgi:hypothetical protein
MPLSLVATSYNKHLRNSQEDISSLLHSVLDGWLTPFPSSSPFSEMAKLYLALIFLPSCRRPKVDISAKTNLGCQVHCYGILRTLSPEIALLLFVFEAYGRTARNDWIWYSVVATMIIQIIWLMCLLWRRGIGLF